MTDWMPIENLRLTLIFWCGIAGAYAKFPATMRLASRKIGLLIASTDEFGLPIGGYHFPDRFRCRAAFIES